MLILAPPRVVCVCSRAIERHSCECCLRGVLRVVCAARQVATCASVPSQSLITQFALSLSRRVQIRSVLETHLYQLHSTAVRLNSIQFNSTRLYTIIQCNRDRLDPTQFPYRRSIAPCDASPTICAMAVQPHAATTHEAATRRSTHMRQYSAASIGSFLSRICALFILLAAASASSAISSPASPIVDRPSAPPPAHKLDWWSVCHDAPLHGEPAAADELTVSLEHGLNTSCIAWGSFSDTMNETGWAYLHVETSSISSTDAERAFSAGFIEGFLSAERILQHKVSQVISDTIDRAIFLCVHLSLHSETTT